MNVISDKQTLRRCIKQLVRNVPAIETETEAFSDSGSWGVDALSKHELDVLFAREELKRTLLKENELSVISAFDALGLGDFSEDAMRQRIATYDRNAWFREILDTAKLCEVLVPVPMDYSGSNVTDDRIKTELYIKKELFTPGKFGTDYQKCADRIREAASRLGSRYLKTDSWNEEQLKYCILPVCEEEKYILVLKIETLPQLQTFIELYEEFGYFHAIVETDDHIEAEAMRAFADRERILMRLGENGHLEEALKKFGLHFIPYASRARTAEAMLGGWVQAKERLWPALAEAYLPMAKAGCELTDEMLEEDIGFWLGGNVRQWEFDFENK